VADHSVEIPNKAAFKASEVCEIARIPPYVLRSWEKEFPGLGAAGRPGGPRIYNRSDVEQILRIKQLVFAEGLTLAGARRRLEGDPPPEEELLPLEPAPLPEDVRTRVAGAKRELRSLLELLSQPAATWPRPAAREVVTPVENGEGAKPDVVATESKGAGRETGDPAASLPLLDGVSERPPKARRPRRGGKEGRDDPASNVE